MKVFKLIAKLLILILVQVTLFGCTGGDSGGDGPSVTSKTRMLQEGDSWIFDVSGQTLLNSQNSQYSGTTTIYITKETLNGESVLAVTTIMKITFNGSSTSSTYTSVQYYQQDPSTGDIVVYGMKHGNDPLITVTDRPLPVIWPGSWETGKTIAANVHYSDGNTETASYTVIGQETVKTSAGTFSTWKLAASSGVVNGTIWFAPQLGYYVKNEIGVVSYNLRSTNVTGF